MNSKTVEGISFRMKRENSPIVTGGMMSGMNLVVLSCIRGIRKMEFLCDVFSFFVKSVAKIVCLVM